MKRYVRSSYNQTSDLTARDLINIGTEIDDLVNRLEGILQREDISDSAASAVQEARNELKNAYFKLSKGW